VFIGCVHRTNTKIDAKKTSHDQIKLNITSRLHIPSDDGQQGIATDGKNIFVQNSQQLFKYDRNGKLLLSGPKLKLHHGGITYVKGNIYAAVSGCEAQGSNLHFVHVYNPHSLELIKKYDISNHFSICAGGIAYRDDRFYIAESFFDNDHYDRIIEFDSSFKHIKDYQINFKSPFGIQGLEYLPTINSFQIHSHGKAFYRINSQFDNNSLISGQLNFELQGLALLDSKTLLINNRDAETIEFAKFK
tara:strand:+ start:657 stop:1394 length:738 start_codon:yes stop_codon:yes gene_type:complete